MGIISKKWRKRDFNEIKIDLDKIVKESEEKAKQLQNEFKDSLIERELCIQQYAILNNDRQMLTESMERVAIIQTL